MIICFDEHSFHLSTDLAYQISLIRSRLLAIQLLADQIYPIKIIYFTPAPNKIFYRVLRQNNF